MKVAIAGTPKNEMNARIAAIQMWIGKNGSSIANAYQVQASTLEELNAPRGVIEKVLWRIARQDPPMELTTQSLLEALEERNLLREVRKQLKLTDKEVKTSAQNFNKSRHAWIASRVPEDVRDRDALVRDVEFWVKSELSEMTAKRLWRQRISACRPARIFAPHSSRWAPSSATWMNWQNSLRAGCTTRSVRAALS